MHRERPEDSSLKALQERILAAKKSNESKDAPGASPLGHTMHIAIDLLTATTVGAAIGYGLDRWLGSLPICTLIGLFVGIAAGVKLMLRTLNEMDIRLEQKSDVTKD